MTNLQKCLNEANRQCEGAKIGSITVCCAFTLLRQTVTLAIKNDNSFWGWMSMTLPPLRTNDGTPSMELYGKVGEESLANVVELSPLMQQYNDFKRSRPSFTPLFHVSGGYETYQGDAERVGKILNLPVQESATHLGPDGKAAKYIIFPDRDFEQYKQVLIDKNIILAVLEDQDKAVKKDSDDNVAQQPPSRVESVQQSQISSYRR